ncbi:MAG: 7-cyano-7-deazaguanine synthase [Phycisphaerae bacterium]|nr:7-cyano-7-deazaguanine synthase [Phycisphaerae bacterium]
MKAAIVLLSGGLDSATAAAIARTEEYTLYALTIDYGQRHRVELEAARRLAENLGVARHVVQQLDLRAFGGSALTADIPVPKDQLSIHPKTQRAAGFSPRGGTHSDDFGHALNSSDIPITYVPARNTIFLSLALAYAETTGAADIFIGVNALDYSGYPDCRPEYIARFQELANLATRAGVEGQHLRIHTPLIQLTKAEIIHRGTELGVDYGLTISCYDPAADGAACGHCDSCLIRRRGFEQAGVNDPTRYIS